MKRFITLLLTFCILLSSVVTINAMEITQAEMETISNEDGKENELMPLTADDGCDEDGDGIPDDLVVELGLKFDAAKSQIT